MNKFLEPLMRKYASEDIHEFRGDPREYNSKELMDAAIKYSRQYYKMRERDGLDPFNVNPKDPKNTKVAEELLWSPIYASVGLVPGVVAGGVVGDLLAAKLKARRKNRNLSVLSGAALGGVGGYLLARKGIKSLTDAAPVINENRINYRDNPWEYLDSFAESDPRAAKLVDKLNSLADKLNSEPEEVRRKKYLEMFSHLD